MLWFGKLNELVEEKVCMLVTTVKQEHTARKALNSIYCSRDGCTGDHLQVLLRVRLDLMSAVTQSPAHAYYEVALFGEFFARDLKPILNRLTLHTESAAPMHTREIVFEHIGAQGLVQTGSQGDEPVLLRARKELGDGKETGW